MRTRTLVALTLSLSALPSCHPNDIIGVQSDVASKPAADLIPGSPINTTADLTFSTFAPQGKVYKLSSCNSTAPAAPYRVELINGSCFAIVNGVRLAQYGSLYYLIPEDAKFSLDKYGYFCGAGWGWGSGNNAKTPLPDGGLDKACLNHDKGWSAPAGQRPSALSVKAADKTFLATLKSIKPRWAYESDYIKMATFWMDCRVSRASSTPTDSYCRLQTALVLSMNYGTIR